MVLAAGDLIDEFGRAAEIGNATVFVGAGLSRGSGLPDWSELLQGPADAAEVPMGTDLPLVAEYVLQTGVVNRTQLELHIQTQIEMKGARPGPGHVDLARLPVDQIWTTNYDRLIEQACDDPVVVEVDNDVSRIGASRRCVIKMHGSLSDSGWAQPPVITRMDYETYQQEHPRMWALLRAAYLSLDPPMKLVSRADRERRMPF
jgi:NAD-dependent SIR2 family protein deacetylase